MRPAKILNALIIRMRIATATINKGLQITAIIFLTCKDLQIQMKIQQLSKRGHLKKKRENTCINKVYQKIMGNKGRNKLVLSLLWCLLLCISFFIKYWEREILIMRSWLKDSNWINLHMKFILTSSTMMILNLIIRLGKLKMLIWIILI